MPVSRGEGMQRLSSRLQLDKQNASGTLLAALFEQSYNEKRQTPDLMC
jgi:hypothetical protein